MFDWLKGVFTSTTPQPAPRPSVGDIELPRDAPRHPGASEACITFIKQQEGLLLTAKKDVDGVYVNGYGCKIISGKPAYAGQIITKQVADLSCRAAAERCVAAILGMVVFPLSQGQLDAFVDFVYNAGSDALKHSTLLRSFNAKQPVTEAMFTTWSKAHVDGVLVTLDALFARRKAEYNQFWVK